MSTLYSIGAMNQLGDALENAGWTADDVTKLKQFGNLEKIKDVLHGKAQIAYPDINTDVQPLAPIGMLIESHIGCGLWRWDPDLIELFFSKEQGKGHQDGNKILKVIGALKGRKILNANVLDYLLAHPDLIPESWKDEVACFWGTIYRTINGDLHIRCLYWDGFRWYWHYKWLGRIFNSNDLAVLAS